MSYFYLYNIAFPEETAVALILPKKLLSMVGQTLPIIVASTSNLKKNQTTLLKN